MGRRKKLWKWNDKNYTIYELCEIMKISKDWFYALRRKGWTMNQILNNRPVHHGMTRTRLYRIYDAMKQRCYNPDHKKYKDYGARNITICDEWLNDRTTFFNWALSNGYNDNLTIDRIDNNKGYSPDNCRWVDMSIQRYNRRNTILLKYKGEYKTVKEIAQIENISYGTAYTRYVKRKKHRLPRKQLYN